MLKTKFSGHNEIWEALTPNPPPIVYGPDFQLSHLYVKRGIISTNCKFFNFFYTFFCLSVSKR